MNGFGGSAIVKLSVNLSSSGNVDGIGGSAIVVITLTPLSINNAIFQIVIGGCSVNTRKNCFQIKYKENDTVYIKEKAERGLLRKVSIKRVIVNSGRNGSCFNKPHSHLLSVIYQDTLNSLYNERDLVPKDEAVALATTYYENKVLETQQAIDSLGC